MLLFSRPPQPEQFGNRMAKIKQAVRLHHEGLLSKAEKQPGLSATEQKPQGSKKKKAELFQAKWGKFKDAFSKAQYGKCAYCEVSVIGAQHGDVEHYYPKSAVYKLGDDPTTWGVEKPYLSKVEGRLPQLVSETGYWWLAYEWSNYLLACLVCNEFWKGAIFPVDAVERRVPPSAEFVEKALLLNPFEDVDPADHLCFDYYGQIHPKEESRQGFETIRTCGLDRPSLRSLRGAIALEVYDQTNRLKSLRGPELKDVLQALYWKGVKTNHHPGMVRIIIKQRSGLSWREVADCLARLLVFELLDCTEPDEVANTLWSLYEMGNESSEDSALVQAIVADQGKKSWETLVDELTRSLLDRFRRGDTRDAGIHNLRHLHRMGNADHSYHEKVRRLVQDECGLSWDALEAEIRFRGLAAKARTIEKPVK
jgi:hypothetical protein